MGIECIDQSGIHGVRKYPHWRKFRAKQKSIPEKAESSGTKYTSSPQIASTGVPTLEPRRWKLFALTKDVFFLPASQSCLMAFTGAFSLLYKHYCTSHYSELFIRITSTLLLPNALSRALKILYRWLHKETGVFEKCQSIYIKYIYNIILNRD